MFVITDINMIWGRVAYGGLFLSALKMGSGDLFRGGVKGGGQGGGQKGGVGPPPKWGSRFGVFLGVKKWSKMVKKGAGRRGKQKCVFRG